MIANDLPTVFFDKDEFATEVTHKLDNQEDKTFVVIFDIKSELIIDGEVVGHQPSILATRDVEEQIKHRSILVINGKEYSKSHTEDEDKDLVRIFLERV